MKKIKKLFYVNEQISIKILWSCIALSLLISVSVYCLTNFKVLNIETNLTAFIALAGALPTVYLWIVRERKKEKDQEIALSSLSKKDIELYQNKIAELNKVYVDAVTQFYNPQSFMAGAYALNALIDDWLVLSKEHPSSSEEHLIRVSQISSILFSKRTEMPDDIAFNHLIEKLFIKVAKLTACEKHFNFNWEGFSFEYLVFNDVDLTNAKLKDIILTGAELNRAKLNGTELNRAELSGAELNDAELNGAELNDAKLNEAKLNEAKLNRAELNRAELNDAKLNDAKLNEAKLNDAKLNEAKLNEAKLNRAELNRAELNRAELNGAELNGAELNGAELNGAELNYADLRHAKLNLFLDRAFEDPNLKEFILDPESYNEVELESATMDNVDLRETEFESVVFYDICLEAVDFSGAIFKNVVFSKENILESKKITLKQINNIILDGEKFLSADKEVINSLKSKVSDDNVPIPKEVLEKIFSN